MLTHISLLLFCAFIIHSCTQKVKLHFCNVALHFLQRARRKFPHRGALFHPTARRASGRVSRRKKARFFATWFLRIAWFFAFSFSLAVSVPGKGFIFAVWQRALLWVVVFGWHLGFQAAMQWQWVFKTQSVFLFCNRVFYSPKTCKKGRVSPPFLFFTQKHLRSTS